MNRWHDRNTKIDWPFRLPVFHSKTSVLGHPALGDVQLAHDLDARDDGRMVLLGDRRHRLCEHAIDTELDAYRVVLGLNVNIACTPLQRSKNRGVNKPDDRAHVTL